MKGKKNGKNLTFLRCFRGDTCISIHWSDVFLLCQAYDPDDHGLTHETDKDSAEHIKFNNDVI